MRYLVVLSSVLALVGIVLVSGSLLTVPYEVRESFRVDRLKVWVDEAFVLTPFGNRTYELDSIIKNSSIIQVDINSSDFIVLKIISEDTGELWYERTARWIWSSFWTPPTLGYEIWRFVFQNPSSASVNVTAKITEFYLKLTEYRYVTYYRSLFEPVYGYAGIVAIIAATGLNLIYASLEARKQNKKTNISVQPAGINER